MTSTIPRNRIRAQQTNGHAPDVTPPHDLGAERDVLGCVLLNGACLADVAEIITPADFYGAPNREIFGAMLDLQADGQQPDHRLVLDRIRNSQALADAGGAKLYLAELVQGVPVAGNAAHYAGIVKRRADERATLYAAESAIEAVRSGKDPASVLDRLKDAAPKPQRVTFGFQDMTTLAAADIKTPWVIPGVLVRRQNQVIGAVLKSCKTKLSCYEAFCTTTGFPFFGKPILQTMPVVLCSRESGLATLKMNLQAIAEAHGMDLADVPNLFLSDQVIRLTSSESINAFRREIRPFRGAVWYTDPWYLSSGLSAGEQASNSATGDRLEIINELADEFDLTPVLVAHCKKPGRTKEDRERLREPGDLADLSGAGLAEWARSWLIITRRVDYQNDGWHDLWLKMGTSAGTSEVLRLALNEGNLAAGESMKWEAATETWREAIESEKRQKTREERDRRQETATAHQASILEALQRIGRGSESDIRTHSGLNGKNFPPAFAELLATGEVIADGEIKKRNGQSYAAFRITGTDSDRPGHT